ncbi:hypothetical protein G7Z17_g3720 [Cylindrodendrum hubeiense]|uniref:Protein-S-isoprenylcysteine O-methyltransferase n=1 Tax=Cylindrodendrum hubeiense TaxID=595255 RepID=A0A9P5LAJ5_9HYPO|nr:hypothetical protein G7Z17_g3720 [Cylindrodendrum hubeiense]
MSLSTSLCQASLAATILASTVGTYLALSPPNPSPDSQSSSAVSDSISRFNLSRKHTTKVVLAPLGLLALRASSLAFTNPTIPPFLLRHGAENGLDVNLITWSSATAIPLALILCAGIPLRLVSYASLGKNFTFALAAPDRLETTSIYRYVQHPSYTGIVVLVLSNMALLCRTDGVLSCWIPPSWYRVVSNLHWVTAPIGVGIFLFGIWTRVKQEERMLKAKFGVEWEEWHFKTPRFLPWGF